MYFKNSYKFMDELRSLKVKPFHGYYQSIIENLIEFGSKSNFTVWSIRVRLLETACI